MAESVTPRHSHIYVDVPVLRARPPQMSLAEVSPHAASSTTGSRKTIPLRKASNASKSTSVEAKRAENASSKKKDASVLPLRPSNVTNSTASKKRAREEDEKILRQATGKKRRNVDPPMKQLNKRNSAISISSSSLSSLSEAEAPITEAPSKKLVVNKPPQEPLWTRVGVDFTREEIENRILIREFVLRFNEVFNLKKPILEKLEDFAEFDDGIAKALLLTFVETIKSQAPSEDRRRLNDFLKQIRAKGMSFYDILYTLNTLRTKTNLHIPNLTKTLESKPEDVDAEALIPVLVGFIDDLMGTKAIRAEVDRYKEEIVEARKAYFASMKAEKKRWSRIRNTLNEEKKANALGFDLTKWKIKFEKAKAKHDTIEHTARFDYIRAQAGISLRFSPYTDKDGRTYYIHTPSLRKPISKTTRAEFSRWVWFVAVWGKKPEDAKRVDFEGAAEGDEDKEGWWGFGDVAEVKKLVQWIQWKDGEANAKESGDGSIEGEEEENETGINATKALVSALNGFVNVLMYADDANSK